MRAVVQRVSSASVSVDGEVIGQIGRGLMVLAAASRESTPEQAKKLADRVAGLRIFNDGEGKMNLALKDLEPSDQPEVLVVSQFTLYGDAWASRRPSFMKSAGYEDGERLYEVFVQELQGLVKGVATGQFGAMMEVSLVNDGPVTLVIDC
ncbi:MAG: D-tyrosyl-tRNA(Tyr) deacylase [Armatimonadetes bacterium]|nr:D-tyrosyl-tRNA(Tyr) deacylase [Armatimonadota bacterium]